MIGMLSTLYNRCKLKCSSFNPGPVLKIKQNIPLHPKQRREKLTENMQIKPQIINNKIKVIEKSVRRLVLIFKKVFFVMTLYAKKKHFQFCL